MTIKELADDLGVDKEKIKYLWRQLPENWSHKSGNKFLLSDAAVDAIRRKLSGGELTSDIPVPEFDENTREGWGIPPISPEIISETGENTSASGDNLRNNGDSPIFDQFTGELNGEKNRCENSGNNGDTFLTIFDHYKTMIEARDAQLSAKDEQINALHAQIDKLTTALTERDTAAQEASERQINAVRADTAEQLTAKDAQLSRMQDTVDALTKQLADAAERERQLQATIEQSREVPRRWWQWWKR